MKLLVPPLLLQDSRSDHLEIRRNLTNSPSLLYALSWLAEAELRVYGGYTPSWLYGMVIAKEKTLCIRLV